MKTIICGDCKGKGYIYSEQAKELKNYGFKLKKLKKVKSLKVFICPFCKGEGRYEISM